MSNSATNNLPNQTTAGGEIAKPASEDSGLDIDGMLASFSTPKNAPIKEKRKAPRYLVNWRADIVSNEKGTFQGLIHDISTLGASIYFNASVPLVNYTLYIQVAPLSLTNKPHVISATGKVVYSVYDGKRYLFRAAVNILRFQQESDLAFLEDRLIKHHVKVPEVTGY